MKNFKNLINIMKKMCVFIFKTSPKEFVFTSLLCVITIIMNPILLQLNFVLVDLVESSLKSNYYSIYNVILIVLGIIIASAIMKISSFSNLLLFDKLQISIGVKLMNKAYRRTGQLPHSYFDNAENAAKVERMALYSQDSMLTQNTVHLISVIAGIISILLIYPVLHKTGWYFFFVMIAIAIIGNSFNFDEGLKRWELGKKLEPHKRKNSEIYNLFQDRNAIREMKIINNYDFILNKWITDEKYVFDEEYNFDKKYEKKKMLVSIFQLILNSLPLILVVVLLNGNYLTFPMAFLLWQTQDRLNSLVASVINEYKMVYFSKEYIDEVMNYIDEYDEKKNYKKISNSIENLV